MFTVSNKYILKIYTHDKFNNILFNITNILTWYILF
jgi:hypothetical protein